jgi:crotonobetainyl-CoA:carnitine CoA-transferase CaiB-like acyl-CoA transferase
LNILSDPSPTDADHALPFMRLPALVPGASPELLAGTRVLDLTSSVAGPYATMLLGDLGADVLKIERPGSGDDARAWGPPFLDGESLWFLAVNRNKRSLTLEWGKPEGAAVLRELIGKADVMVVNQPARVLRKLGIGPEQARAINPGLIYVAITGFGLTGERADWTCYDLIAEGYSGVMDLTGVLDGEPQKVGAPAADMLAGQDAAMGALAALLSRTRTGAGQTVDVALVDSMTRFLSCRIVPYMGSAEVPRRSGGRDSVIAIYQAFATRDEPMTLGLGNDAIWQRFWQAVGRPEYAANPAYASNADRRAARGDIVADIQALLLTQPRAHWLDLCAGARVPAGPINRVDEVAADPALHARGLLYRLTADGRNIPQVGTGIHFDGAALTPHRAPPRLGADSEAALAEWLGYDAARVAALRQQKLV